MSLLEKLKSDRMSAFKAGEKVKSNLLATLIAEAKNEALKEIKRDPTDAELEGKIRKFLKNIEETMGLVKDDAARIANLALEKSTLESYLPKQLSGDELRAAIESIVAGLSDKSAKAMGQVMADLKVKYGGNIDMKAASQMVKDFLQG